MFLLRLEKNLVMHIYILVGFHDNRSSRIKCPRTKCSGLSVSGLCLNSAIQRRSIRTWYLRTRSTRNSVFSEFPLKTKCVFFFCRKHEEGVLANVNVKVAPHPHLFKKKKRFITRIIQFSYESLYQLSQKYY